MIVDVSHLGDAGFWDVAHMATRPFIATHSNARAVCGHTRNLTDEMLRAGAHPYIDASDILNFYGIESKKTERDLSGLNETEREVYRLIASGIGDADTIVEKLGISAVDFNCAITTLELSDYVIRFDQTWAAR